MRAEQQLRIRSRQCLSPRHKTIFKTDHGGDQSVRRPREHFFPRADLRDAAMVHDPDALADGVSFMAVMGDEHYRYARSFHDVLKIPQ